MRIPTITHQTRTKIAIAAGSVIKDTVGYLLAIVTVFLILILAKPLGFGVSVALGIAAVCLIGTAWGLAEVETKRRLEKRRMRRVIVYVTGILEGLRQEGLVEGGHWKLAPKTRKLYCKLQRRGFGMTPSDVIHAFHAIQGRMLEQDDCEVLNIVLKHAPMGSIGAVAVEIQADD